MGTAPDRFDGAIAGLGSTSGTRIVLGMWVSTPFGPIADAMIERVDGHRILVAPTREVADYIAATYRFDEVRVEPVTLTHTPTGRRVESASLTVGITVGRRTALGALLRCVPTPLARARWWLRLLDPLASRVRRGVHTVGTAGGGRREYYGALDEHLVVGVTGTLDGADLGALTPVDPAVRFGFASTPRTPSIVRVTTTIVS